MPREEPPEGENELYAVTPDGKVRWVLPLGEAIPVALARQSNGTLELLTRSDRLLSVSPAGRIVGRLDLRRRFEQAGFPGRVYGVDMLPTADGLVIAASTGRFANNLVLRMGREHRTRWCRNLGPQPSATWQSLSLSSTGEIAVASVQAQLALLSPGGRVIWWQQPLGSHEDARCGCATGPRGEVYLRYNSGLLLAFSRSGDLLWEHTLPEDMRPGETPTGRHFRTVEGLGAPLARRDGSILNWNAAGFLAALRPDGTGMWRARLPPATGLMPPSLEMADGSCVFAAKQGVNGEINISTWMYRVTRDGRAVSRAPVMAPPRYALSPDRTTLYLCGAYGRNPTTVVATDPLRWPPVAPGARPESEQDVRTLNSQPSTINRP